MIRTSWLVALALCAFSVSLIRADETYTIKIKSTAKGDVGQINKEETEDSNVTISQGDNVLKEEKKARKETVKYKEEIIDKEKGKRATSLKRTYDKAVATEDGKEKELPYSGKTLLIEKKGGKYSFTIDKGDALKEKEVPSLVKEFSKEDDDEKLQELFLPKKAVAVGDSWDIDKDSLKALFGKNAEGMKFDVDNSKATGTLKKAYKKGNVQYGVIQYDVQLPLDSLQGANFEKGSKMNLKLTVDVCIDGTEDAGTVKGDFTMAGTLNMQGITVKFDVKGASTETREEKK